MRIDLNEKKLKCERPTMREKVELGEGWFCWITDNKVNSEFIIFTIHGASTDESDFAEIETQMKNEYRWINFIVPGYDGIDERRGNYQGTYKDIVKMIKKLLDKL